MTGPEDSQNFRLAFESCSLTRDDWDHRAHIRLAWIYLQEMSPRDAVLKMKAGIFRFDEGTEEICNYHETMTVFWFSVIAAGLEGAPEGEDFDAFLERNPKLANKRLILEYYTQPRVVAPESRENFVPPDRLPLPFSFPVHDLGPSTPPSQRS